MPLLDAITRAVSTRLSNVGYRLGGTGGSMLTQWQIPPGWNYSQYLKAYGDIGWLFGAVSIIANSVASVPWHLYYRSQDGELEEVDSDHPMLRLWRSVNPFQTKYQFVLLWEMYTRLVGEAFVILDFNSLHVPARMWLAPPQFMNIIPHPTEYISHYEYRRSSAVLRLEVPEVIHDMEVDPAQPYRGRGVAQSIAQVLDAESHAERYQNRLWYNDGRPGMVIQFPKETSVPSPAERERYRDEYNEAHQGWRNAFKTAFLWGGATITNLTLSNRDLDFWRLRKVNRDAILGAFHIPSSLIGLSEVGSRARVEADEYVFAKYTIKPSLVRIREVLNEQLCPLFDEMLHFDFEDPVPDDRATLVDEVDKLTKAGVITREEGRAKLGYDPEPDPDGTFLGPTQSGPLVGLSTVAPVQKALEDAHEALWKRRTETTDHFETEFADVFQELLDTQAEMVVEAADLDRFDADFDLELETVRFAAAFLPVIRATFDAGFSEDTDLTAGRAIKVDPPTPSPEAMEWMNTRSLELAKMVNGTTHEELRAVLAQGFADNDTVDQLARRIRDFYGDQYRKRAKLVARTEVVAAYNEGAVLRYDQAGIKMLMWYVALDDRVCPICIPYHQEQFPAREARGLIPAHPACRCTWIPVTEGV